VTGSGPTDAPLLASRYAIGDPIGRGRSTVHRATDTRLRRQVAIKEVRLAEAQEAVEQVRLRATREAQAAARLNNPGVVTVYDVVEEGGSIWLVMELVEAPSLAQIVGDEGPLTHPRAARIGQGVVSALRAAHAVGIVHRDVKPANVLVMIGDRTKLADFGVATIRDESRVTATGTIVGSPSYMAPEQAMAADVGPFTDLWALGATLYFAVEGVPPFVGDSPLATASAVVHGDPRAPKNRGPLTGLIMRLLDKDASRRPAARQVNVTLSAIAGRGTERRDDTLVGPSPLARGGDAGRPAPAAPSPRSRRDPRRIVIPGARRKAKAPSPTPPRPQRAAPLPPAVPAPAPAARADEAHGDITYASRGKVAAPAAGSPVADPAVPPEAPAADPPAAPGTAVKEADGATQGAPPPDAPAGAVVEDADATGGDTPPADAGSDAVGAPVEDEPVTPATLDDPTAAEPAASTDEQPSTDATRRTAALEVPDEDGSRTRPDPAIAGETAVAGSSPPDTDIGDPTATRPDEDEPRTQASPAIATVGTPDDEAAADPTGADPASSGAPDDGVSHTQASPVTGDAATAGSTLGTDATPPDTAVAGDAAVDAPATKVNPKIGEAAAAGSTLGADVAADATPPGGGRAGAGAKVAALGADARKRWGALGPQRQRVIVAVAVLVLLAVTIWALAGGGDGNGGGGTDTGGGATTASTTATSTEQAAADGEGTTTTTAAEQEQASPDVPDGWTEYQHPAAGYTIAHPAGWQVEPSGGPRIDISDPESGSYLRIDWTDEPQPDPVADWRTQSEGFASRHEAYREIRIEPYEYRDYDAAVWEFTYRDDGADLHVANLGFVAGPRGYALYFQTPEDRWASSQETFTSFRETFRPPA
jgi:tRNA A-37 threonylcarbamoyl transferase component Bud32